MVRDSEATAQAAEASLTNAPGYCLQWSRERAAIGPKYGDAATAWANTKQRRSGDRNVPRGAMAYWTGGRNGYGHIAPGVGAGNIRSTDAGGQGKVATVDLGWVERAWGLTYVGWAWDVNDVTIPQAGTGDDDVELSDSIAKWSPDDGGQGQTTVGKTLNQARGFAEDGYDRVKALQGRVDQLGAVITEVKGTTDQILALLRAQ